LELITLMRKLNIGFAGTLLFALLISVGCKNEKKPYEIQIITPLGEMKAILYDDTPRHRDNFVKLVKDGFYDSTLFHRCITDFMIQGGDPDSKFAEPGQVLGGGDLGYTLEPEFGGIHKKGALSAARLSDQVNPGRQSNASQFFIVQGIPITPDVLDYFKRETGKEYTEEEIQIYSNKGGRPDLDMNYTVFGELTEGFDVLEKILALPTDTNDRPFQDVPMEIKLIGSRK
jgi:cyclophilin family peptidyl-prolyl cis-trans isomerase